MQEMKKVLENTVFEIESSDGLVKVKMSASQEIKEVILQGESGKTEKTALENAIKDAYNKAIKRSQGIAAEKMRGITGFNIPGLE